MHVKEGTETQWNGFRFRMIANLQSDWELRLVLSFPGNVTLVDNIFLQYCVSFERKHVFSLKIDCISI